MVDKTNMRSHSLPKKFLSIFVLLLTAFVLVACAGAPEPTPDPTPDPTVEPTPEILTRVYFYNNLEWANVSAYVFGDAGEVFGGWPGTLALQDDDTSWYYVEVGLDPDVTVFTIIFNWTGGQTGNIEIDDSVLVYLTTNNDKFDSKEAAEASFVD